MKATGTPDDQASNKHQQQKDSNPDDQHADERDNPDLASQQQARVDPGLTNPDDQPASQEEIADPDVQRAQV